MENKTKMQKKFAWAIILIILGVLAMHFRIGERQFLGFASVGTYLVYIGFVSIGVFTWLAIKSKDKLVDERMRYITLNQTG